MSIIMMMDMRRDYENPAHMCVIRMEKDGKVCRE